MAKKSGNTCDISSFLFPFVSISSQERDVTIVQLYGQLYISVLRQQPRVTSPAGSGATGGAEIVLCQMLKDGQIRKTDVMRLDMNGRFAISVVDNLVIVHIQVGFSLLFRTRPSRPSRPIRCDVRIFERMRCPTNQPTNQPTNGHSQL